MAKPLTRQLIVSKTRSESLELLKNLNLWGHDIDDISILETLPSLEVLVLSVNKISSLKDFSQLKQLRELYIRKNEISDISEIQHLMHLPKLKILWLDDNPCDGFPNYRHVVLKALPNLIKLDNYEVSHEERQRAAQTVDLNSVFNNPHQYQPQQQQQNSNQAPSNYQSPMKEHESQYSQQQQEQMQQQDIQQQRPPSSYHKQKSNPVQLQAQQDNHQQESLLQQQKLEKINNMFNPNFQDIDQSLQQQYQAQQEQLQNYNQYTQSQNMSSKAMATQGMDQRNENVVCAILALIKDLDESSLEIIRRNVEKKIGNIRMYNR